VDSPDSYRISVPGSTQVSDGRQSIFAYGALTLYGRLSHTFPLTDCFVTSICQTLQPHTCKQVWFGLFPVRSPLLGEYFLFLQVLRCFSSLGALPPAYVFSRRMLEVRSSEFPHSEIPGSKPVHGSPRLIAVSHVLHRHLAPRHSPKALSSFST
jgi:hypothetical protein